MPAASARARAVRPPPGRVPAEYIGRARALRNRVGESAAEVARITEPLVAPLRPRPGFTPMPRHDRLRMTAEAWRVLPLFGRLRLVAGFAGGKLQIAELRAEPAAITADTWEADEPALAVVLYTLAIQPPAFEERRLVLSLAGLHALARRYQRGADRTDKAVIADLHPLARRGLDAVRSGGEFTIPAPSGGYWVGAVGDDGRCAIIRTYLGHCR